MTAIQPRGWQASALPVVVANLRKGRPSLVSACTGAGKSIFLALLLRDIVSTLSDGWAIVVTVPTEALVEQLSATLREHASPDVGRWYGRVKRRRQITVCCLPSLEGLIVDLAAAGQRCALWIGDEVHRAEAYEEMIDLLAPRVRLGLTATPYRSSDGLTMWPELTYRYSMTDAISDGVLVPPVIELWRGGEDVAVTDATIAMIHQHAQGPGVVSAEHVDDAEETAHELNRADIPAAAIHSRLSSRVRAELLEKLRLGEYRALVHVRVLSEGVDLPWLRWLALRTSHSRTRVGLVQEVGRVLRIDPNDPEKREGLVLDPLGLTLLVGISHPADLVAAASGEEPEKERKERETRELIRLEEEEQRARTFDELSAWLARERHRALGPSLVQSEAEPTQAQISELARRRKSMRWLDKPTRARVESLLETGRMDRQTASDIIAVLKHASGQASKHVKDGGSWRNAPKFGLGT